MAGQMGGRVLGRIDHEVARQQREEAERVRGLEAAVESRGLQVQFYKERAEILWAALREVVGDACESHAEPEDGCSTCSALAVLEFMAPDEDQHSGASGD